MGLFTRKNGYVIPIILVAFLVFVPSVTAFGAGNIPSISSIEGINFRHGDIEDMLKTVACIKGHKWTSMMIKRVYFGILVWVLSFLSFGYATQEFEVTDERLGVYRPEEHIDNPKDYADNKDARHHDPRLRGPVQKAELEIDMNTGMKNYIANEYGGWATSSGYVKFSLSRSIHFGRLYTSGSGNSKGNESDLCEALRCLGQALHCLEDFSAHSNYVELALREMGYRDVFPHTGVSTELNIQGHYIYPLTTGTFGAVDFLHSVSKSLSYACGPKNNKSTGPWRGNRSFHSNRGR
ncbi:Bgt-440 [Blumeria graminis f. sp. tritici]|uniref:Bgt-440 n=2 Tax=Blumeria graminis f. sp. tritici TaxID=62690 RepID=A0A381L3L3_BLUGR|nr:DNA damage-responsive protein [Blumeria graminis f. sp. tritici 96224]VDB94644.1 Bgt-440 [Blumeria graminis f. sp. tritici]